MTRPRPFMSIPPHSQRIGYALRVNLAMLLVAVNVLVPARPSAADFISPFPSYATGASPQAVAVGDLNGDGRPDIVSTNYTPGGVSVLLGEAGGGFAPRTDLATGADARNVAIADMNGDGFRDLLVVNYTPRTLSILLGNGDGTFGPKTDYACGAGPQGLAVGDLDGDGDLDVTVSNLLGTTLSVFPGSGTGTVGTRVDWTVGKGPRSHAMCDVNGDGRLDVVTANSGSNTISVLLGDGAGGLGTRTDYATGSSPRAVASGDLNGDGRLDLAVPNSSSNSVSIFLQDALGGFAPRVDYTTGGTPQHVAIADFTGDGRLDVAAVKSLLNSVAILPGNGDGTLGAATDYATGSSPQWVAAALLNADASADLVVTNSASNSVSVGLSTGSRPRITVNPAALDFGSQYVGQPTSLVTRVTNAGSLTLNVGAMTIGGAGFTVAGPTAYSLAPGAYRDVSVTYARPTAGTANATLAIASDDPVNPTLGVGLTGVALPVPVAGVSPEGLTLSVVSGGTTSGTLTLGNTGAGSLTYGSLAVGGAPAWFGWSPQSGTVLPGSTQAVTVTASAASLYAGQYGAVLEFTTNDPARPTLDVPVLLTVSGTPAIAVSPPSLDFGPGVVGSPTVRNLQVRNVGTASLAVTGIAASEGFEVVGPVAFAVAPGSSQDVTVRDLRSSAGGESGTLTITSDAPTSPTIVALAGVTSEPPAIAVTPTSFAFQLEPGAGTSAPMVIRNDGGSVLEFQISASGIPGGEPAFAATRRQDLSALLPAAPVTGGDGATPGREGAVLGATVVRATTNANRTLVLATADISASIERALSELGESYDYLFTSNFAAVDFTPYSRIIVGLDGGSVSTASVQALATAASQGRGLFIMGGTVYTPFYSGLQSYLLTHTGQTGWTTSAAPHLQVVNAADPLAAGLPASKNYANTGASYYMLRINDVAATVVATNGTGYPVLVHKPIGTGQLVYFTSSAHSTFWQSASDFAVLKQIVANAVLYTGVGWLSVAPSSGTIPAFGSATVDVRATAADLAEGSYSSLLKVASNDPLRPAIDVPATLVVGGVPRIALSADSLDFGTRFVGQPDSLALRVTNSGTAMLVVSALTLSGADFTLGDAAPFSLTPGAWRDVSIGYARTVAGTASGMLTIASNAEGTPSLSVPLSGAALPTPTLHVVPDSVHAALAAGDSTDALITLSNTGAGVLTYQVGSVLAPLANRASATSADSVFTRDEPRASANGGAPRAQSAAQLPGLPAGAAQMGTVLILGDGGSETDVGSVLSEAGYAPTYVPNATSTWDGSNPSPLGYSVVVLLDGITNSREMNPSAQSALLAYVQSGGGLVVTEWAAWEVSNGRWQTLAPLIPVTRTSGNIGSYSHSVVANHPVTAGVAPSFQVAGGFGIGFVNSGTKLVQFSDGTPAVVAREYGSGRVVYFAHAGNYDGYRPFLEANMKRLLKNAAGWTGRVEWLSFESSSGTLNPGESVPIHLGISARLLSDGFYANSVPITSNDPLRPAWDVPVTLRVTGIPQLVVSPAALDFGTRFVGEPNSLTLRLSNPGTAPLDLSGMTTSSAEFSVGGPTAFTLLPGSWRDVTLTYLRTAPSTSGGTLTIASNDPSGPRAVPLAGVALEPPVIAVTPASFAFEMAAGESESAAMSVRNDGGSDLAFRITKRGTTTGPIALGGTRTQDLSALLPAPREGARVGMPPVPPPTAPGANALRAVNAGSRTLVLSFSDLTGSVERALGELGESYDYVYTADYAAVDYSPYSRIIVGLTGETVEESAIAALAAAVSEGRGLIVIGGTNYWPYYTALQNHLLKHDGQQGWWMSGPPHLQVVNAADPLARGLPASANYTGYYTSYYSLRINDPEATVVAVNGDGWPTLVHKPVGAGELVYFNSLADSYYWPAAGDYSLFKTILANAMAFADVPWLSVEPDTAVVPANSALDLVVRANAAHVVDGAYAAEMSVNSNDPANPAVVLPVQLLVHGTARIAVSPDSLGFGSRFVGLPDSLLVRVKNVGTATLGVSGITSSHGEFSFSGPAAFSLAPGTWRDVAVTYRRTTDGTATGTLTIASDDAASPTTVVRLEGTALPAPVASLAPDTLHLAAPSGSATSGALTLGNSGLSALTYSVYLVYGTPSWLSWSPSNGTVEPGAGATVNVDASAASLYAGEYATLLRVFTNDPMHPAFDVPVLFTVTGEPAITATPPALDFGTGYVGYPTARTIRVANTGTDLLRVNSMTADAGFSIGGATAFDLAPAGYQDVTVFDLRGSAGTESGALIISSDAATSPTMVPLAGVTLEPPVIATTPPSFAFEMAAGESASAALSIRNDGASDLAFRITKSGLPAGLLALGATRPQDLTALVPASPVTGGSGATPGQEGTVLPAAAVRALTNGSRTLVLATTDLTASVERVLAESGESYDYVFTENFAGVDFSPYSRIVVGMDGGFVSEASVQALASAAAAGRGIVVVGGSNWQPFYNGLQSYLIGHTGGTGWTTSATPHLQVVNPSDPLAAGLPASVFYANSGASYYMLRINDPAATVVAVNGHGFPVLVHKPIGAGRLVYFTSPPDGLFWSNPSDYSVFSRVMSNALAYADVRWLSVVPDTAVVPAHGSMDVEVRANASQLVDGSYHARLDVNSNDPANPVAAVPVQLLVHGMARIAVSPESLDFGRRFVGVPETGQIRVTNAGTATLNVSAMTSSATAFTIGGATAFSLTPGASRDVPVTCSRSAAGVASGTLTIASDDAARPSVVVALLGEAVEPPVAAVSPDTLRLSVAARDTAGTNLVIGNSGLGPLAWDLSFEGPVATWLAFTALSGVVAPGAEQRVRVVADAGGLFAGTYQAALRIATDDPNHAPFVVPVIVQVTGAPRIAVSADTVRFDSTWVGIPATRTLVVRNDGTDALRFAYIAVTNEHFTLLDNLPAALGPGQQTGLRVRYSPLAEGAEAGEIEIRSDDPTRATLLVRLEGVGRHPAIAVVTPASVAFTLDQDTEGDRSLSVRNDGLGMLNFSVTGAPYWLSVVPGSGSVAPGGQLNLTAHASAVGRPPGTLGGAVTFATNDPLTPGISVPATLDVIGVPPGPVAYEWPADGQINLPIQPTLRWSPSARALGYDLYLWKSTEAVPASPTQAGIAQTSWTPSGPLATGTPYRWKVVAVNASGSTAGPVRNFTVETLPDLVVSTLEVPPTGFSGQPISVRRVITNQGDGATNVPEWSDYIYLSPTANFDPVTAVPLGTPGNVAFLAPGESYAEALTFTLPEGITGQYYVFVDADARGNVRESREDNNRGRVADAMQVTLTPPPNLRVTAVIAPANGFSGQDALVTWSVWNVGTGGTRAGHWIDAVHLSADATFDPAQDPLLGVFTHSGALDPGGNYGGSLHVLLPQMISGPYHVIVRTDAGGAVYENVFESDNWTAAEPTMVTLTPPPDFVVSSVTVPATAASGMPLEVRWTVQNQGAEGPFEPYWYDRVYLSTLPTFEPGSSLLLGTVQRNAPLPGAADYEQVRTFALPVNLAGTYYAFVHADHANNVFENGQDGNNVGRSFGTVDVQLTTPPDLVVSEVHAPATGHAADPLAISWTVTNAGDGRTLASQWTDRAYLVQGDSWDPNRIIATRDVARSGGLEAHAPYTVSTTLVPPRGTLGATRVFVTTDVDGQVFENAAESNNQSSAGPVDVTPMLPSDLVVTTVSAPAEGVAGRAINVGWSVRNDGPRATYVSSWRDEVFLSADASFDPATDLLLGSSDQGYGLGVGNSYSRAIAPVLPADLSGDFYVFVASDRAGANPDPQTANNILGAVTPTRVTIVPPPPPADLRVSAFTAPPEATAGQAIVVGWSVTNDGPGATPVSNWYDGVVLSADAVLDGSDLRIASVPHAGALEPGVGYDVSLGVEVPAYLAGGFYLMVGADSRNDVGEPGGEGNNVAARTLHVNVLPPSDLIVEDVGAPATATPGENATISWTLRNAGVNRAIGHVRDGIYISSDAAWNVDDAVIGLLDHSVDIPAGGVARLSATIDAARLLRANATGDITAPLPGVTPGPYQVLVRTDLRNVIHESDETNNLAAATASTDVDVARLQLGVTATPSLTAGQARYYRLDVPAGLDLRFRFDVPSGNASGELYVAFGRTPSLSDFDVAGAQPFESHQRALVPSTSAGSYYVMVLSRDASTPAQCELLAEGLPFSLLQITPAAGGADGLVTCVLEGAGLKPGLTLSLRLAGDRLLAADRIERISNSQYRVRWFLAGVPTGTYDVVARNTDGAVAELPAGFRVESAKYMSLAYSRAVPPMVWAGGSASFTIQLANAANVDIPFALVYIGAPRSQSLAVTSDRLVPLRQLLPSAVRGQFADGFVVGEWRYLPFLARDVVVGELIQATAVARGITGTRFPLRVLAQAMSEEVFTAVQLTNLEQMRAVILANPSLFSPEVFQVAQDPAAFRTRAVNQAASIGLINPATVARVQQPPAAVSDDFQDQIVELCDGPLQVVSCGSSLMSCALSIAEMGFGLEIPFWGAITCGMGIGMDCILPSMHVEAPGWLKTTNEVVRWLDMVVDPIGNLVSPGFYVDVFEDAVCTPVRQLRSSDPNDIQGPSGYGAERWVASSNPLPYVIHFENDSTKATAPARVVTIRERLDDHLDPRSFRLGSYGLGTRTFEVPANRAYHSQRLDLRDSLGVYVDVSAGVDVAAREAFWVFRSIDPATGQTPENPLVGLLPINDSQHRGEGFVTYTVRAAATVRTRDTLTATATIVFDNNDPIDTPSFTNLLDAAAPSSAVHALPLSSTSASFDVRWSGADDEGGSGLQSYDVYVRRGSEPFTLWLGATTDTGAVYTGRMGEPYAFYSISRDNSGMVELPPASPDATTFVGSPTPALLSLTRAEADPERAVLEWYSSEHQLRAVLYRRDAGAEWARLCDLVADGTGKFTYEDRAVAPGSRYGYRLGVMESGAERFYGEAWVDIPRPVLALYGASPNPARADLAVSFSLPGRAPAQLEVFDIAGRRIASRAVGGMGAGRHVVRMGESRPVEPGVYILRLSSAGRRLTAKTAVLN